MSKAKSKGCLLTFSFLISTIFSLTSVIAVKNHIPLVEEIAGTYFVSYISGMLIRDFLMRVIFAAVGVVAFLIFLICGLKGFKKPLFPYFTVVCGIFLLLIPNLSAYTFSRFAGTLLSQTITGTIIIINACLMTIGSGFGIVAVIDFVRQSICLKKLQAHQLP